MVPCDYSNFKASVRRLKEDLVSLIRGSLFSGDVKVPVFWCVREDGKVFPKIKQGVFAVILILRDGQMCDSPGIMGFS
jgi:hypothetical protein